MNACWAPMTSLLSRLIRAPVWVRVKKAIGIFWMCSKTFERMSKMRPSPTLAETHRIPMDRAVSTRASTAATRARPMISDLSCSGMPLSMMERNSRGLMTPMTASMTTRTRNQTRIRPVGAGELDHPPGRALGDPLAGDRVVPPHGAHHPGELTSAAHAVATHAHGCTRRWWVGIMLPDPTVRRPRPIRAPSPDRRWFRPPARARRPAGGRGR